MLVDLKDEKGYPIHNIALVTEKLDINVDNDFKADITSCTNFWALSRKKFEYF